MKPVCGFDIVIFNSPKEDETYKIVFTNHLIKLMIKRRLRALSGSCYRIQAITDNPNIINVYMDLHLH